MKTKIRVMMVEDNPDYGDAIRIALETEADIELISTFGTAERAVQSLQVRDQHKDPDVILLDLNLPGISGLDALPYFRRYIPVAKIIVLTQSDQESDVLSAISGGASGYLLKAATLSQITEGIRTVVNGGASLDANVARYILSVLQNKPRKADLKITLSSREMEILTLLCEGLLKKEIADQLDISIPTVATHVRHIYEKLEVKNAAAAVHKAHRLGILLDNED